MTKTSTNEFENYICSYSDISIYLTQKQNRARARALWHMVIFLRNFQPQTLNSPMKVCAFGITLTGNEHGDTPSSQVYL